MARTTRRLLVWLLLVFLLLPGQLAWLGLLRFPRLLAHGQALLWGQIILGAACVAMLALLRTTPPNAIRLTPRASVLAVVAGTLLLQVAAVVLPVPETRAASDPAVPRAIGGACAVAAVALLAVALRRTGESPWHAALLGWNPLLTLAIGGTGDADAVGLLLVAAALSAAAAAHRFKLAAAALALACGVKPHALLLLPFLWRQVHEQRSFRAGRRVVLVFLAMLAAVVVAAAVVGGQRGGPPFADLTHFGGGGGEGNALLYESFQSIFGGAGGGRTEAARDAARLVGVLVVLGMGMLLWQSRATPAEAGYWLFMFGLLFAPAVRPEALLWVLVFIPLVRGPQGFAALTWAATVAAGYPLGREGTTTGTVRPAWLVAEYLPVLCVLAVEVLRLARIVPLGRAVQSPGSPVPT